MHDGEKEGGWKGRRRWTVLRGGKEPKRLVCFILALEALNCLPPIKQPQRAAKKTRGISVFLPPPIPRCKGRGPGTFWRSSLLRTLPHSLAPVLEGRLPSGDSSRASKPQWSRCSQAKLSWQSGCTRTSVITPSLPGRPQKQQRWCS